MVTLFVRVSVHPPLYTRYGVREYWMVDPEEKLVQVLELGTDMIRSYSFDAVESSVLPGIEADVESIFEKF